MVWTPVEDRCCGVFPAVQPGRGREICVVTVRPKRWRLLAGMVLAGLLGGGLVAGPSAAASTRPITTSSRYESTTDPGVLYAQGKADGQAGLYGATILDWGRPASANGTLGTIDFAGHFDAESAILAGAKSYVDAYYAYSPRYSVMHLMVGTSNSCGSGQPCGIITCGCSNEPASFYAFGQSWAGLATGLQAYIAAKPAYYTTVMNGDAADDAEPGYDPGYTNTYNLLAGYASTGRRPLADYGSLDGGLYSSAWSPAQQYQVAYGFAPDVPFAEVYYSVQASQWAALDHWSVANRGHQMTIFGVLTQYPSGGYTPQQGYDQMLYDLNNYYFDTHQSSIQWSSNI